MLEACRTCLMLIDVDNLPFYEIEADDKELSMESCRYKLLSIVPEMELNITSKSIICAECHGSLEALFEYKEKCLKTENIIAAYLKTKPDADMKNFDLKDVSGFNGVDIKNTEDTVVENVVVKDEVEEVKLSEEFLAVDESITIVKHEVDNYLLEDVELVDVENKVLESNELMRGKFKCQICSKEFNNKSLLNYHVQIHSKVANCLAHGNFLNTPTDKQVELTCCDKSNNEGLPECKICKKKDASTKQQEINSAAKNFECEYCHERFIESAELKDHLATHTKEKLYRCEKCDKKFLKKYLLIVHKHSHTRERPYERDTSQKIFKSHTFFSAHKEKHSDDNNWECKYCNKTFEFRSMLVSHLRTHTGVKPYCCEVCDKRFRDKQNLNLHMRIHTGEKPYECETCHMKFSRKTILVNHLKMHLGVKEFECKHCKKRFKAKYYLNLHISSKHVKNRFFPCLVCKKMYYTRHSVKSHIMRIHKDVDINTIVIEEVTKQETQDT